MFPLPSAEKPTTVGEAFLLRPGAKVRIKHYEKAPGFWDSDGEMMKYCGRVVTIAKAVRNGYWNIVEDTRPWTWQTEDFEAL